MRKSKRDEPRAFTPNGSIIFFKILIKGKKMKDFNYREYKIRLENMSAEEIYTEKFSQEENNINLDFKIESEEEKKEEISHAELNMLELRKDISILKIKYIDREMKKRQ